MSLKYLSMLVTILKSSHDVDMCVWHHMSADWSELMIHNCCLSFPDFWLVVNCLLLMCSCLWLFISAYNCLTSQVCEKLKTMYLCCKWKYQSTHIITVLQSEVMNSTFCIEEKDKDRDSSSNITPTTENLAANNSRTRKVLKMIEKNCTSSGEFEKPRSRLGVVDSSNQLVGGVKRKRKLLKSGSFFEPLWTLSFIIARPSL